ncbi:NADPH-dependent FMN reductase [Pseudomonas syringae]|uniref:NADPH-dependent FMN reductase n=1 Tax=Pseudomonas syringae TaxID=317 RepID=UPI000CDA6093|nr:NADPH-dependent FMN reductase [Pseudomonas syringae]POP72540.1 NADPH-dependent FMN reductase [Pseudomonas syringae pv. syringae]QQQ48804.1 NADPH-dependent FMN reductase [Pseudomonas syringae]
MRVVSLSGSPSPKSRSGVVLAHAGRWLQSHGVEVTTLRIRDFNAEDLLFARFDSPQVLELIEAVSQADGLLIGTPVYKASFSGALKTLLDLLPERALHGKVVLPLATGGSIAHMLAVDYALKPVLSALKSQEVLHGIFAIDTQVNYDDNELGGTLDEILTERLHEGLEHFHHGLQRRLQARHQQAGGHLQLAL